MKQKLLNLWLLAVMMIVGSSGAWADELVVNSAQSAYVDSSNGTTNFNGASQTNLKINNTQFRDWGSSADGSVKFNSGGMVSLYKFDLAGIKAITGTIQKIEFSIKGTSSDSEKGVTNVRLLGYNPSWDATTITFESGFTNNGANVPLTGTVSGTGSFQPLNTTTAFSIGTSETTLTAEATTYVNSAVEANNNDVSFAVAANLGRVANLNVQATLTVTYTTAAATSYTVKAVAGTEELSVIASGIEVEGKTCYINGIPKAIVKDEKCYMLKEQTGLTGLSFSFVKSSSNETLNVQYELAPSIAYFAEVENLSNTGATENLNYSNGKFAHVNGGKTASLTTLIPGKYTASGYLKSDANRGIYFRKSGDNSTNVIVTCPIDKNSAAGEYTTSEFVLTEDTPLYLSGYTNSQNKTNQSAEIDYVYITRTGDAPLPGAFKTKAELTGDLGGFTAAIEGNVLTLTSTTDGFGFETVKLNMTKGTAIANTGSVSNTVWTGNAKVVELTFDDINNLNSIIINNGTATELPTAATIAAFKATTAEALLTLSNAEVLEVNAEEEYTIVQDATGGLKLKGIVLNATAGNRLVGTLAGIYADNAELVNGTQTDYTAPKASGNAATAMDMTATEAQTAANVYRLVSLKGVSITNDGTKVTATDKSGTITVDPGTLTLADGDVLASLTGFFYPDGTMKATAAQSGLIWKANDMTAGQALPIDLTAANYVNKLADVAMGDAITIETLGAGTIDVQNAAGQSIVKYELTQDENTLHFPVTADVVSDIQKHGLQLVGEGVNAVMAYKVPGLYSANMNKNTVWYTDDTFAANDVITLGAIHFTDVREGDKLDNIVLDAAAAGLQQDKPYKVVSVGGAIDFEKLAVRDDKAEAKEGEEFAQGGYQSTNGMVMSFGGLTEGQSYSFKEAYPAVNKFGAVTKGVDQFPVDDNNKAYDPAQKNVPTKGTFYVFNPTKDGALDVTVALEEGKKLYVTEEGEALDDFNGITKVTDNMISFPVEAGKTYYVFANESNLQYYGFTFIPTDAAAQDLAKNIDIFKKLTAGTEAKLMLNDAVVTYIKGDNVFVEDESGAIDFFETRIQYYDGQKLNGYIIGENNSLNNLPVLRWTAATPTSKFTAEKGKAQSKRATVAEALKDNGLARFVKLYSLAQARDERGFRILLDEAGDTIYIEDHFNVFYELPDTVKHVEGIVGINAEENRYIWPTSQDAVVANLPMEQIADGKYLLRNVASGLYLGAANNWGTRATLMNYSEYVTLKAIDAETYTIESQVSNGGTSYYFNGSYMDGAATNVTLAKDGKYYTIKSADKFIGFSDAEPAYVTGMYALGLDVDGDSPEALWEIIPATADALKGASQANPVDATFMVLNPNFGRNNRNTSAWTISASNQNLSGGTNENKCAESYHSAFTLNQTITGLPIGTYKLTAQGFYRQDGSDTENLPYFYVNDQKRTFPVKTGAENSMDDASASFAKGLYTIEPITVTIVDGILNIGAKNDNTALWCIWDNFQLKYCGTANVTIDMFIESYETALDAANQLVGEKMSKNALNQLNDAIGAEVDKTSQESLTAATNALNEAIDAAKGSIESYKILAVGTLADNNLTGWTCTNANTFHINTWSVEGNEGNDPSGMVTPFIENWVGKPGPLGEGKIFYTLKNINPSEVKVTALVRIYSESGEEPQGASFFVGKQKVDIATVGTSFEYNGMKGIYGTIEATGTTINGSIVFGVEMASPTFNWVAIKNVTIEATEKDDIPAKTLNFTPDYWNNTNVQMELGTTEVAKAWDTANKVDQPLYNVTMPEEFSGSLALQVVKDWAGETKGWWLRSAVGGLYAYGARRPAAITNLKAGNYVVFTCTRDASGVITLLNGEGQPDGPYTFEKDADGRYCCTMTANGNLGFCGVMNVGYLKTIDIYDSKPVVTGIENVQSRLSDTEAVYNLRGQKVTGTLKPGLYIKNGKKVVIK